MPGTRALVVSLGGVVLLALATVSLLVVRDEQAPVRGDLIAYACPEPKNPWYAVCVVRHDGTGARRLTERLPATDPTWSPNGRRIAFTLHEDVGEYTTFAEDDVAVMDADGDGVRQVTDDVAGKQTGQPSWSPDGEEIAYVRGTSVASQIPGRPGSLFVMAADGSDVRQLTDGWLDSNPAWSPDGSEIVFTRSKDFADPSRRIYVLDVATGDARELTRTADHFDTAPAWSPDGSLIAFARAKVQSTYDGTTALHVMRRDGSDLRLVARYTHFDRASYSLAWSPDGRTIAFETSSAIGCTSISLVGVDGSKPRALTTCTRPKESSAAPAWQPALDTP